MVELGLLIGKSAGDIYYIHEAFGDALSFLHAYVQVFFLVPSGTALVALTSAEYIMAAVFNDGCGLAPKVVRKLAAAAFIS